MPKYWGKQIFTHGRFPEVGQKQKTEREKKIITMASYVLQCHLGWLTQSRLGQKRQMIQELYEVNHINSNQCMILCQHKAVVEMPCLISNLKYVVYQSKDMPCNQGM